MMNRLLLPFAVAVLLLVAFLSHTKQDLVAPKTHTKNIENYFADGLTDILMRNEHKAISDFTSSADEGNADAAYNLGLMIYYGQGVPISYADSFHWTLKGAEEGNVRAQYNVSVLFEDGDGTPQDYNQSEFWGDKSASSGYSDRDELSNMYDAGDDDLTNPAEYASAIAWTKLAAERGDPISAYDLAINYDHPDIYTGTDFLHDPNLALKYYKIATKGGMEDAKAHVDNFDPK